MSPVQRSPAGYGSARRGLRPGSRHAGPPAVAGDVDLHQHLDPGAGNGHLHRLRRGGRRRARSARTVPAELTLLRWTGPRKCQRIGPDSPTLAFDEQLLSVAVLAHVRTVPRPPRPARCRVPTLWSRRRFVWRRGHHPRPRLDRVLPRAATPTTLEPPVAHGRFTPPSPAGARCSIPATTNGSPNNWCTLPSHRRGLHHIACSAARTPAGRSRAGAPWRSDGPNFGPNLGRDPVQLVGPERVTARVNARAEHRFDARRAQAAHRRHRRLNHAGSEASPTGVGHTQDSLGAGQGHRSAVRSQHRQGGSPGGRHRRVGGLATGATWTFDDDDSSAVDLLEQRPGQIDHCARRRSSHCGPVHFRPGRPARTRCCAPGSRRPAPSRPGGGRPGRSSLLQEVRNVELVTDKPGILFLAQLALGFEQTDA